MPLANCREVPQIVVVEVPTEEQLIKKSWLLNPNKIPKPSNEVYVERVSTEINEDMVNLYRSRSLDIYDTSRRSYLSQWSRETTPIDSQDQYERNVRRSYTSIREFVQDARMPMSTYRYRSTPLNVTTLPYHSNYRYYQEQQPFRKYDIFQIRTWAYPIYKYLHGRDHLATRPISYNRIYGNSTLYTPPKIAAEPQSMTERRSYSGYVCMAGEHSFNVAARPQSLDHYHSPWYWTYYGNSGLRHYNSFRPRAYTSRLSTYWSPYY
uniref:Uncharacterized protein n=1 Tax=Syphacia muris TaxID=451379 RepID=A0A0N5A946_9BILA